MRFHIKPTLSYPFLNIRRYDNKENKFLYNFIRISVNTINIVIIFYLQIMTCNYYNNHKSVYKYASFTLEMF